jgi:hypothetical protein
VAKASMPALIFPFIMPDYKAYTTGKIELQYKQPILTLVNLDEESVSAIPDSEYSCLNPH